MNSLFFGYFYRMRNLRSVNKQEFLRKWIMGIRKYSCQKKNMSLMERKKAIKLSADLAMASTRDQTTLWSKALINNASREDGNNMLASSPHHRERVRILMRKYSTNSSPLNYRKRRIRSVKVLRRRNRTAKERVAASSIAKRLVQKRTRRLKSLLPGGEFMDDVSLVDETLDYIQSLRAQVEVMRCLVTASDLIINPP